MLAHAEQCIEEATELARDLSVNDPNVGLPLLGKCLRECEDLAGFSGRLANAVAFLREQLAVYRELATIQPALYEERLADALSGYVSASTRFGENEEALNASREAADLYRRLVAREPGRYEFTLANELRPLSERLVEAGRFDEALQCAEEAASTFVQLYDAASAGDPERKKFDYNLALSLATLANCLDANAQFAKALEISKAAVERMHRIVAPLDIMFGFSQWEDYRLILDAYEHRRRRAALRSNSDS